MLIRGGRSEKSKLKRVAALAPLAAPIASLLALFLQGIWVEPQMVRLEVSAEAALGVLIWSWMTLCYAYPATWLGIPLYILLCKLDLGGFLPIVVLATGLAALPHWIIDMPWGITAMFAGSALAVSSIAWLIANQREAALASHLP